MVGLSAWDSVTIAVALVLGAAPALGAASAADAVVGAAGAVGAVAAALDASAAAGAVVGAAAGSTPGACRSAGAGAAAGIDCDAPIAPERLISKSPANNTTKASAATTVAKRSAG